MKLIVLLEQLSESLSWITEEFEGKFWKDLLNLSRLGLETYLMFYLKEGFVLLFSFIKGVFSLCFCLIEININSGCNEE